MSTATALALIGLAVIWAVALVLVLSLCRAGAKQTPTPSNVQGALRAMGDQADRVWADETPHWRGGWRV